VKRLSIFLSFLIITSCVESESSEPTTTTLPDKITTTTTTMALSDEATELIMSLPVVEFEDCPEENLIVTDIYPLVIYIGSSTADIKEVFIQIDDEASEVTEYTFTGEDVPKKDQVRTYSLNLELLDYESDYTIFITAYAVDVEDNQDGKVCSIVVKLPEPMTLLPDIPDNPGDTKNCGDFADYAEAKAWFDTYYEYYGDVANLDSDDDLEPCESLPGGP
tara:strand:+ start:827 stop:1486 length:660 start_codon:yes stop_codon:yes gene_type:complete